jgi:hypothetical protein
MSPFETLYGWHCRTPLSWSELGERIIFGPNIVTEAEEKVKQIRANIMTAQSRQKNYTDKRRRPLEFEVGDHERCTSLRHQRKASPPPPLVTAIYILSSTSFGRCLIKWSYHQSYRFPLEPDMTYKAYPIKILDQQDRVTRNKTTWFYKVQWNDHSEDETMWEHENFLWSNYPEFLLSR